MASDLPELLDLAPTETFALALSGRGGAHAIRSDSWAVIWHEARALIEEIPAAPLPEPPRRHQALLREGGSTWHFSGRGVELTLARLFRPRSLDPEAEEVGLAAMVGRRGSEFCFCTLPTGAEGRFLEAALRAAGAGAFELRRFELYDLLGAYPRSQDPSIRPFAQAFIHPVLGQALAEQLAQSA